MKILSWLFSISDRYFELREDYEKSRYPFFRFLLLVVTALLPTLIFLGVRAIKVNSGGALFGLILLVIIGFMALVKTPKDLFILSLVALSHGFWVLVDRKKRKLPAEENLETNLPNKKKKTVKWEKSNANPIWDFIMAVLGIVLAVASFISPIILFIPKI